MTTLLPPGATPTALTLPANLSYEEWAATMHAIGRMGKAVQFWLGDALLYGESQYGEAFAQAASETGYSSESLRGFLWVATKVPPSVRRLTLSWGHHQAVASSPNAGELLEAAEANSWSVRELREQVRGPSKPKPGCPHPECPLLPTREDA